jgi:hypothetical protein
LYARWIESLPNPKEKLKEIESKIPLGNRMTTAEEIANMVAFLLSERSSPHDGTDHSCGWRVCSFGPGTCKRIKMKTLICTRPGLFDYVERELPHSNKDNTILRIQRIGICGTDLHAFEGTQPYFQYPRVLGHELAAVIEETGADGFQTGAALSLSFLISIVEIVLHVAMARQIAVFRSGFVECTSTAV